MGETLGNDGGVVEENKPGPFGLGGRRRKSPPVSSPTTHREVPRAIQAQIEHANNFALGNILDEVTRRILNEGGYHNDPDSFNQLRARLQDEYTPGQTVAEFRARVDQIARNARDYPSKGAWKQILRERIVTKKLEPYQPKKVISGTDVVRHERTLLDRLLGREGRGVTAGEDARQGARDEREWFKKNGR